MQLYQSILLICLVASLGSNCFTVTATTTTTATEPTLKTTIEIKHQHRFLRPSRKVESPTASTPKSEIDETTEEDMPLRRDEVVYEVDNDTGSIYYTGSNDDTGIFIYGDDFTSAYVETCDGFKYQIDDNGFCRPSTGYVVLMVFVNIAIIIAIVIASCSCCKCCIWYPYLCCASEAERLSKSPVNQQRKCAARQPAYPVINETQNANVKTVEVQIATAIPLIMETQNTVTIETSKDTIGEPEFEC